MPLNWTHKALVAESCGLQRGAPRKGGGQWLETLAFLRDMGCSGTLWYSVE
jgi:hypothetical protein